MKDTEILVQLDRAAEEVSKVREGLTRLKAIMAKHSNQLAQIPAKYSQLLEAVNDAEYGVNELELVNKQKLAAISADYVALQEQVTATRDWIAANITEF
jgi:DNA repair ATPase RecN